MLQLQNIVKDYQVGDNVIHALRDVSICFRPNEFVAILGPSGGGKTTLLNIIGGLDQYTSGDLLIGGTSTRDFHDRDWDSYRNHRIGFVFQSYNLIPHQTVLQNVELALTLSGVSKAERRARAKQALEKVGLGDQLNKKPNQMSGGQMQRVAIARALVNDPEILLADEPTGALDSETSVQVMDILRDISAEKLIIMVTHNPDLARQYATRTVQLLDGQITSDTNPYAPEEELAERDTAQRPPDKKRQGRTSMSFFTAFGLSCNNLLTKKGRTILTAFAGSIGIIGIALILSIATGIQDYIDQVQEDTLSSYPITIEAEQMDMGGLVGSLMESRAKQNGTPHEEDRVYASTVMYDLMNSITGAETQTNNLELFKAYLDDPDSPIRSYASAIQYSYDLDLPIYTQDENGTIVNTDVVELLQSVMSSMYGGDYSSYFSRFGDSYSAMDVWEEMLPGEDGELISSLVQDQYDVLYGHWPQDSHEVVLVIDKNNEISDLVMYALGLRSSGEMEAAMQSAMNQESFDTVQQSWSYAELCGKRFRLILPWENYYYDEQTGTYSDLSATDAGLDYLYGSDAVGISLTISGIIRADPDATSSMLQGSIGYTSALTREVIEKTRQAEIMEKQLADPDTDVITGLPFRTPDTPEPEPAQMEADVAALLSGADVQLKARMYTAMMCVADDAYLNAQVAQAMQGLTREAIEAQVTDSYAQQTGVSAGEVAQYIAQMDDETLFAYVENSLRQQISQQYAEAVSQQLSAMTDAQLAAAMDQAKPLTDWQISYLYDNYMPPQYSDATYDDNLSLLGYVDLEHPSRISLYATSFSGKDAIADCIADYNKAAAEDDEITYTDYVALLMRSITTIIDAISYVLIAFVSISLIVSSIMIGIITYISVLERTKEIGILRAIGASKRDVSRVFNAETLIEGLAAGLLGIGLTLLLLLPINAIIQRLTGISTLSASLPAQAAVILIAISMLLTFIAGLIPSRLAAKKDPVTALRSE